MRIFVLRLELLTVTRTTSVVRHSMYRLNLESGGYISRVGRARGFLSLSMYVYSVAVS